MLEKYQKIVFWVGAGLSQASGVRPPQMHNRLSFLENPDRVWADTLRWREHVLECQPNPGHRLLARFQQQYPPIRIVTLNQDGLLQRAGCEVLEMHGSIWESRCFRCDRSHCDCRARQRPHVVWVGEDLPEERVEQALAWLADCDLLVGVGTSGVMPPAGEMPAQARQAHRLEINLCETPISSHYHECWRGPAEELLAKLAPSDSH